MSSTRTKNASTSSSSGVVRSGRRAQSTSGGHDQAVSPLNRTAPTRAKSGCWTCRLRRKKCDENRRSDGSCDTCKRLRLQCLGWGAKRPEWCRDKDKVEQYKLEIKQQVSFHGNVRSSPSGLGLNARPLTPNASGNASENNHDSNAKYSYSQTEPFDFTPVFIPSAEGMDMTHHDNYFAFANLTNMNLVPTAHDLSVHANPATLSADMDPLSALLAYHLPTQQLLHQQQNNNHAQIWSNQTTPEMNSGGQSSPMVNPITNAIDQSMVNMGMPQTPITIPPGQSSWDSLNYPPFGSLPPLYGAGSGAYMGPEPSVADTATPLGPPSLLALQGSVSSNGIDVTQSVQKQPQIDSQIVRKQIFYYFNRVRKMQYWFAGESTKDVLRDIVVANPYGVVTNAICALASIHHTLMLKSIGKDVEDPELSTSLPRRFFDQASEQIMASKAQNGAYTALDATAALQLVSFSLLVGGVRGWENALQIAGDWYEKTGVVNHENPLRAMWELNLTAKFASRLVVWFDIFSSITLQRPARFLSTYRQMLRQDEASGMASKKFWRKDLNMQATMGCSDAVLLALAETAELAQWRDQEKKQGSLSNRELNRRADLIEQDLRACKEELELEEARAVLASSAMASGANGAFFGNAYANTTTGMGIINATTSAPGTPSSTSGESVPSMLHATPNESGPIPLPFDGMADTSVTVPPVQTAVDVTPLSSRFSLPLSATPLPIALNESRRPSPASSSGSTARSGSATDPSLPAGLSEGDIRRRAARIFLEGALLYLQTVVSDSNPNVPEVVEGVRATMESAYLLPPSDIDKSLVFPFFIAGVYSESPEQREFFRARLGAHKSLGNCASAVRLMEAVWKRREDVSRISAAKGLTIKPKVHWRDVMEDLGIKLLLV